MSSDTKVNGAFALSPRAGIALLTLQLRTTLQEASVAEAEDEGRDETLARAELRTRLEPLMEERRRALVIERSQVEADAAAAIAAARAEADRIVAKEATRLATPTPVAMAPVVLPPVPEPLPAPAALAPSTPEPLPAPAMLAQSAPDVTPPDVEPPAAFLPPPVPRTSVVPPAGSSVNVVIDAEAFAQVFAAVFSTILDERLAEARVGLPARQLLALPPVVVQAPAPAPPKQSFWTHARHPDVFLMGLATVIVLVVLVAWMA
jgi:hypothetical protein